jgi:ABC-2 type transport system ATP-binding protein
VSKSIEARMLEAVDLSKSYRGVPAVRSLALTARPGQVIGLLGPNGSGKSTTVKMLVGLLRPSRGTIRWRGRDIHDDLLSYQRIVGYVPEEPRLYDYLNAPEYLELIGGLHDIDHRTVQRRIGRYLELFGLEHDIHTPLASFSKGMRQKVLIAAALMHDPELIVLDEPNSGLDVASTLIMRRMIAALTARGRAIIYSSHEMDAVEKVCDEVLILHASHVVAHDSVARLRELSQAESLEQVFAQLAVDEDVDRVGAELALVATT